MNQPVVILKRLYTLKVEVATMVPRQKHWKIPLQIAKCTSKTKEWESEHVDNIISVGNNVYLRSLIIPVDPGLFGGFDGGALEVRILLGTS